MLEFGEVGQYQVYNAACINISENIYGSTVWPSRWYLRLQYAKIDGLLAI